jgi:hypothetical protein
MKFTPKTQQKWNREGEARKGRKEWDGMGWDGMGMLTSRLMHPGPPIWSEFL